MRLTPRGIREHLGLNKPIYARTSAYGHFGRQPDRGQLLLGAHRPGRRIALGGRIIRAGAQPLLLMAMRSSICTRLWRGWPLSL